MAQYVLLASHAGESNVENTFRVLKSNVGNICDEVCKFDVPDTLKFSSFDTLVKLLDDLHKYDGQVEGILRRIERQMLDLNPQADFKVRIRQELLTVESYIRRFMWDSAKWPQNRKVDENATQLWQTVARIDEDIKNKSYGYTETKTTLQNMTKLKGPTTTLMNVDLVDILTPECVQHDDFIYKEHLTTVLVVVPRGGEKDFLDAYEKIDPFVVPRSAKQFQKFTNGKMGPIADKDANTLWRIVCFKKCTEAVRKGLKDCKCSIRDFTYSPTGYKEQIAEMDRLNADMAKKEHTLKSYCADGFGEVFSAWMHLKAMRVYVECILRYGVPPNYASFIVRVTSAKAMPKLRQVLGNVFTQASFGKSHFEEKAGEDEEAYYPYVCLPFSAFTPAGDK